MLLAILLMGASLTVFLWGAGGISYGDSASSTPLKVTANAQFYPTFGTPNDALVTAADAYVLISVSEPTGIQVFKNPDFTNPCGGQQILKFSAVAAWRTARESSRRNAIFSGPAASKCWGRS